MGTKNKFSIVVGILVATLVISSNLCLSINEKIVFAKDPTTKNLILGEDKSGRTTLTVYSDGYYDHSLMCDNTNYYTAHDASTAEYMDWSGANQMEFGQKDVGSSSPNWYIDRCYAYFDTSGLPDNAVITSVQFTFWNCHGYDTGPRPILMAFYDPSGIYPHQTLQMGDYDIDHYSDTGAGTYTINLPSGQYKTWTWNSNAYNKINKNEWTKIMFTTQGDWQSNQGSDQDYSQMYSGNSPNPPYLTIQYSTAPPGDPSNLDAYNPTYSTIDLSWTKGSNSDKTMIRRKTGSYPSSPSDGSQAYFATGTSTTDTGLNPSTTYYYRAWAYDSNTGQYSTGYSSDCETTSSAPPPGDPTNLNAYNPTSSTIDLSWTKGSGGDKTMIRRSTGYYPSSPSDGTQAYFGTGTYTTDTGLNPSTTYYYRAWAYDSDTGQYSIGYSEDYETTSSAPPPGNPSNLNAYNPTSSTIDLSWTKGTNSDKTMIRRKTGTYPASPTDGSQAYFNTGTSTTDTGLNPSTTYYYRAWAYDSNTGQYSTGYSQDQETTLEGPSGSWTVIAYLCGDDNLGSWCQQCLNYMTNVGSQNGIQIIALIDGQGGGDSRAYYVLPNNQVNIPLNQINPGWGNEVNMGDPQTLISFSTYCINNYPAGHYLIIPQDHGGSWVGCCWDDSEDNLDIDDLQTAFQQISVVLGKKTDVVFFNDCLMNGVEIAYQLQPYVDYQAGSETISWTSTCDNEFQDILQYMVNNPNVNSQDLSTYIIDHQSPRDSASYRTQSISSIELDRMQDLASAVDALAIDLYNKLDDAGYRDQIENARTQSEYTEGPYGGQIERLIDLYDFVYRIRTLVTNPTTQTLAQNILNLIGPAGGQYGNVINRERHTSSANFCHGMSVYFPDRSNRYDGTYLIDNDFITDTNWDEFLAEYLAGATGVGYGWDTSITAKGGTNGASYLTFGEDEYAADGYDENIDVQHTDLLSDVEIYSLIDSTECSVDIKHGPDTSKTWDIYVEWQGSDSEAVELSWDSSPISNEEYPSVILYDCDNNKQIDMLTSSSYNVNMNPGQTIHMKIICSNSENNPPVKPQPPSGPTSAKPGREYTYTAVTIDPDNDIISYIFDWGDGTTYQTAFVESGQVASATHKWTKKGSYEIKVKAIDEQNMESEWSEQLPISVPRTFTFKSLLLRLIERYPHAFPILRHILELQ